MNRKVLSHVTFVFEQHCVNRDANAEISSGTFDVDLKENTV